MLRVIVLCCLVAGVFSHGRLRAPPSRSSMWRDGFPNPENPTDNELNCGGFSYQWIQNGGKCGTCGDKVDGPLYNQPGPDNKYANGIIGANYTQGQIVDVAIQITANHKGWFEFRLCPHNNPSTPVSDECLDQHLLELADGSGTRWHLTTWDTGFFYIKVQLPSNVTCTQCVFVWKWHCGNTWGCDEDNNCCTGCDPRQEQFYGCADIGIVSK